MSGNSIRNSLSGIPLLFVELEIAIQYQVNPDQFPIMQKALEKVKHLNLKEQLFAFQKLLFEDPELAKRIEEEKREFEKRVVSTMNPEGAKGTDQQKKDFQLRELLQKLNTTSQKKVEQPQPLFQLRELQKVPQGKKVEFSDEGNSKLDSQDEKNKLQSLEHLSLSSSQLNLTPTSSSENFHSDNE